MGMLETRIKKVPEGSTLVDYAKTVRRQLEDYFTDSENSCEDYKVAPLTEQNFEQVWEVQETYKNTPEIKEKYRGLAKENKLLYIEIDY